jgi:hypothetical protein
VPAPSTGPARLARASVVAVATVALALAAHVLGGGAPPSMTVLVPLAAVVLAGAVPFSGRRTGPLGAVALLGGGQLALHHAFDLFGAMGCAPTGQALGHAHAAHAVDVVCTGPTSHPGAVLGASAMLVLHVVATLATALLIAGTDRALSWAVAWLRPLVALLAPVRLPVARLLPVKVETRRAIVRIDLVVAPLRGPPAGPAHVTLAA